MTQPRDDDGAGLGRLLTDMADDPDAPPSSVSAASVIAAARAPRDGGPPAVSPSVSPAVSPVLSATSGAGGVPAVRSADRAEPSGPDSGASVGELHVLSVQRDADRRARRRRTMIFGGLAAACAVAVAAVVIPIAVSNSSSTTSAGSAADQSPAQAPARAESAAAAAPSADAEAPADQGSGAAAAVPTVDPSNPDANRPPPGENALSQTVPVPGGTAPTEGAGAAAGGGAAASCWPALSDAASAALVGALPAGAFGAPGPLGLGCPADPVGGAQLAGAAPDTQLVVRVTRADPGACAQAASETGARCVARGGDQYVANDAGNLSVYAYGNGYEVEVGGRPATGIAPIPSGLTADQLSAAAAAVLGTLG